MEAGPDEGQVTGSQIHPLLRQRMLNRAATFTEGAKPIPAPPRRRSSLLSDTSDTRYSFRSSSDNLIPSGRNNGANMQTASDEPSIWASIPILAAIIPALVGLTHENGAAAATDILILGLASWFLHFCVRTPWEWYHEAQQRRYVIDQGDADDNAFDGTILEEDEEPLDSHEQRPDEDGSEGRDAEVTNSNEKPPVAVDPQNQAREALKREELIAFVGCFIGPLLGALLLHALRGQLTRAEGIVSNFNLAIFFLGAEIRPCRLLVRMKREKILHLQRIVRSDMNEEKNSLDASGLAQRVRDLEARSDGPAPSEIDVSKVSAEVRQSIQLQLDALNRAVRRYEKRHMAQSLQIESRFQEVDARLQDTLSLAAAAARTGQRPGLIASTVSWFASLINYVLFATWNVITYPLRTARSLVLMIKSLIFKDVREPRKRPKGQVNGHTSMATSRMWSKSAR